MNRRTVIKALPLVASGGLLSGAAMAGADQTPFASALTQWEAVQARCKPISNRHNAADAAQLAYLRDNPLTAPLSVAGGLSAQEALNRLTVGNMEPFEQVRAHGYWQTVNLRSFDYEDAQWKIKGLHAEVRANCAGFIDKAALDRSEATALELMDLIIQQEKACPVIAEFEAADADWKRWLEEEEQAFIALCGAATNSNTEARLKQAAIRESSFADYTSGEVWFDALVSSIA